MSLKSGLGRQGAVNHQGAGACSAARPRRPRRCARARKPTESAISHLVSTAKRHGRRALQHELASATTRERMPGSQRPAPANRHARRRHPAAPDLARSVAPAPVPVCARSPFPTPPPPAAWTTRAPSTRSEWSGARPRSGQARLASTLGALRQGHCLGTEKEPETGTRPRESESIRAQAEPVALPP